MESYIVRIYRQGSEQTRSIIGVVETVGTEGREAFTNVDELWGILNPRKAAVPKKALNRKRERRSKPVRQNKER